MKNFILLCGLLFLELLVFRLFTGCKQQSFITTEEELTLELPSWPPLIPEFECKIEYPKLSRWCLTFANATEVKTEYISSDTKTLNFVIEKNQPFCVTLIPITIAGDEENSYETSYFKPAGYIYPFQNTNTKITWEQGFIASVIQKIIKSKEETGVSSEHINSFLGSFNWKKAQETIEKKISEEDEFFNPWLIDSSTFLENLSFGYFKSTYLNITYCYVYDMQQVLCNEHCLSSFIPENERLFKTGKMKFKKNQPTLVSDAKNYGVVITAQSSKKMSKEVVFLPIFIEDI